MNYSRETWDAYYNFEITDLDADLNDNHYATFEDRLEQCYRSEETYWYSLDNEDDNYVTLLKKNC